MENTESLISASWINEKAILWSWLYKNNTQILVCTKWFWHVFSPIWTCSISPVNVPGYLLNRFYQYLIFCQCMYKWTLRSPRYLWTSMYLQHSLLFSLLQMQDKVLQKISYIFCCQSVFFQIDNYITTNKVNKLYLIYLQ